MPRMSQIGKTATTVYTENGFTSVRYHSTEVVKFSQDKIILNSGGWRTVTTKTRMNQASHQFGLRLYVYQIGGNWFVDRPDKNSYAVETFDFQDGMELSR